MNPSRLTMLQHASRLPVPGAAIDGGSRGGSAVAARRWALAKLGALPSPTFDCENSIYALVDADRLNELCGNTTQLAAGNATSAIRGENTGWGTRSRRFTTASAKQARRFGVHCPACTAESGVMQFPKC